MMDGNNKPVVQALNRDDIEVKNKIIYQKLEPIQ